MTAIKRNELRKQTIKAIENLRKMQSYKNRGLHRTAMKYAIKANSIWVKL